MTSTSSPFALDGRVAVVTGGNRGIGRSIALGLARAGAAVAILSRDEEKNHQVLAELQAVGVPAMASRLDVTDRSALADAVAKVERELGSIDVLVNNAGIAVVSGGVLNETEADWDTVMATHLHATFLLSKFVAASMAKRKHGKIINLASMYSFFGSGMLPSYSAAKGGIVQLTKSMAVELAAHNIQVNAIAPGWIATEMTAIARDDPDFSDFNKMILARTPAARWGEADEVAGAAVFLASGAADFVTGTTFPVAGGYAVCKRGWIDQFSRKCPRTKGEIRQMTRVRAHSFSISRDGCSAGHRVPPRMSCFDVGKTGHAGRDTATDSTVRGGYAIHQSSAVHILIAPFLKSSFPRRRDAEPGLAKANIGAADGP